MKKALVKLFPALILLLLTVWVFPAMAEDGGAVLPGINAKDDHPQGCVSCHVNKGDGKDYRLSVELKNIKGHPDITKIVKTVPDNCLMCHKDGSKHPLSDVVHKHHYDEPKENHFIAYYKGQCLECHALDLATGEMSVKSGPKNW